MGGWVTGDWMEGCRIDLHGYMHVHHEGPSRPASGFREILEGVSDQMYSGVVAGEAGDGAGAEG